MNVIPTAIPDVLIFEPKVFGDARGFFMRHGTDHHSFVLFNKGVMDLRPDRKFRPEVTINQITWQVGSLKEVVDAFRRGGGEGKPMILKVQLSYHSDEKIAKEGAFEQWRNNIFKSEVLSDLKTPAQFEAMGEFVTMEDVEGNVRISSDPQQHIEWLQKDIELGFDELILHNVNREKEQFIDVFGKEVLPVLMKH